MTPRHALSPHKHLSSMERGSEMNVKQEKLLAWHRTLLSEAGSIAYRLAEDAYITDNFLEDLAYSLENIAARVRREKSDQDKGE